MNNYQDCEAEELFRRIANLPPGKHPYMYQTETLRLLSEGKSVLLHAPTGSGKSEAAFVPFLAFRGQHHFPARLIYVLPSRALVEAIAHRFRTLADDLESHVRVAAHHGRRPESVLFYADVVVATVDQVISSYACAPLTLGVRHGNIPAGAVATSFVVFDEVHTFDPERALQSCLIVASRLKVAGVPFVIMTATLASQARDLMRDRLGLTLVEAREADIPVRRQRRVTLRMALERQLTPDVVREVAANSSRRILVVCNTVDRAVALCGALVDLNPVLVHSRFLDDDRTAQNNRVQAVLGQNGRGFALVLATQAVEVGLDISCDVLLTELCPVDALIQRAGRCARWAETPGELVVFGLPQENGKWVAAPYDEEILQSTARTLEEVQGKILTWDLEQELVDRVLGPRYKAWLDHSMAAQAAKKLADAAFTGDRKKAEEAVRETDSVEVTLHSNPEKLRGQLRFLPRIAVSVGLVRRFVSEHPDAVWSLDVDASGGADESHGAESVERVRESRDVRFGRVYILSSHVSYSSETGLFFEGESVDWKPLSAQPRSVLPVRGRLLETLEQHVRRGISSFRRIVSVKEGYGLDRIASVIGLPRDELERLVIVGQIFHDLGKANDAWQRAAWETVDLWLQENPSNVDRLTSEEQKLLEADRQRTFLARFPSLADQSREPGRPPHATIGAYVLWDWLSRQWSNLGAAAALAMAHHHSVRACQVPRYRLRDGWADLAQRLMREETAMEIDSHLAGRSKQESTTRLPCTMPPFHQEKLYTLYVLLSRCLSVSDRMAAGGGEDAILDYEKWAGNL
ncbi:MAG TPA: CRISPR-associated helicase Cas3' [candidate division Zixibacteria bacterium]|nr:CRISPR-associated helicase Cas3' [candidate division Zixibacteria bacterium]